MGLIGDVGGGPVAVDTVGFIYWIEDHPTFSVLLEPLFTAADAGDIQLVTSAVTLLEVLVVPYRSRDFDLAERYEGLLSRARNVRLIDIDRGQLRTAAQLRAAHRLRTPDALQIAAALGARCPVLVTNDRSLPDVPGLEILQLSHYS